VLLFFRSLLSAYCIEKLPLHRVWSSPSSFGVSRTKYRQSHRQYYIGWGTEN